MLAESAVTATILVGDVLERLRGKRVGAEAPMFNEVEVVPVSASYSPASPAAAD